MKNLKNEKLIFNTAVLSNFARIKKLELIFYLSSHLYTTREVIDEIKRGVISKPNLKTIIKYSELGKIKIASLKQLENILLMDKLIREGILGPGEISAMLLARELSGMFITNDEVATKRARKLKIKILDPKEHKDTVTFLKILKLESHDNPALDFLKSY